MTRPEDRRDPRSPDAPIVYDDRMLDRQRSRVSLEELLRDPETYQWATQPVREEPLDLPEIPPERLAELRARRDEILERIRQGRGEHGG